MNRHRINIDTEFTSFRYPSLISIGVVSACGASLYMEADEIDEGICSTFTLNTVLPLLLRAPDVVASPDEMHRRLALFLKPLPQPIEVCYDYIGDWRIFYQIATHGGSKLPHNMARKNVFEESDRWLIQEILDTNSWEAHHALNDATALMLACEKG